MVSTNPDQPRHESMKAHPHTCTYNEMTTVSCSLQTSS